MDSLTQLTLGAAVGEALLGKKLGNKAILLGAIGGTIPDLDVLFTPLMGDLGELTIHRAFSHSFLFAIFVPFLLMWICKKIPFKVKSPLRAIDGKRKRELANVSNRDWYLLWFLCFLTHILLDACTTYGTQLFYPIDWRVAFNNISIADPVYTIPFFVFTFACLFFNRLSNKRRIIGWLGIGISSAYMLFTFGVKTHVHDVFFNQLEAQNVPYNEHMTAPTILNTMLWVGVAATDNDIYLGYYSLLDGKEEVEYDVYPKNHHLLEPYLDEYAVDRLLWFSDGFYTVEERDGILYFYALKFGKGDFRGTDNKSTFLFYFSVDPSTTPVTFKQHIDFDNSDMSSGIRDLKGVILNGELPPKKE